MKRTLTLCAAVLALPVLLGACSTTREDTNYTSVSANAFMAANYRAADALALQLRGKLGDEKPLIMATIVNIDALEQTSMLGRLVSEQLSTRLDRIVAAMEKDEPDA